MQFRQIDSTCHTQLYNVLPTWVSSGTNNKAKNLTETSDLYLFVQPTVTSVRHWTCIITQHSMVCAGGGEGMGCNIRA